MNQAPAPLNRPAACHGMSLRLSRLLSQPLVLEGFQGSAVLESVDVQRILLHGLVTEIW